MARLTSATTIVVAERADKLSGVNSCPLEDAFELKASSKRLGLNPLALALDMISKLPKYTGGLREVVHPHNVVYYIRVVGGFRKKF